MHSPDSRSPGESESGQTNRSPASTGPALPITVPISRRAVVRLLAGLGIGTAAFRRAVAAQVAASGRVTDEMVRQAEWIAGITLNTEQRDETAAALTRVQQQFQALRDVPLSYDVPPALLFRAELSPAEASPAAPDAPRAPRQHQAAPAIRRPASDDDLAYLSVTQLGRLLRTRQVSSVELTRLYLKRLRTFDRVLHCVVDYTEQLALGQAEQADRELAAGHDLGPLHGIPWGAKDLIAVAGYKTTWGAAPFRDRVLDVTATVAQRLTEAGAVLIAKLSLGALAWGDQWYGGMTRNPWNLEEGSSGSSAGSAAAAAAGLAGFTLGSETHGSIISPCRRCGATGLRPTFGRISRYGCMPLSWSMDKIGPIARTVEDCALVLAAIHGADPRDASAVSRPFRWPSTRPVNSLRVGYFPENGERQPELGVLRELGVTLVPIQLPQQLPVEALSFILSVEAATVFDELTRSGATQGLNRWPGVFRAAEFVPAVEYLRAQRVRTLLMQAMDELLEPIDAYVQGDDLAITNLTGHPTVVMPGPMSEQNGQRRPSSITFTGKLFGESELLALAQAFQEATGYHRERPPLGA